MLNFKDWKLAGVNGSKASLRHKDGHEMAIFMGGLPKIQREQILRLAKAEQFKSDGEVQKFSDDTNEIQQAPDDSQGASADHSTKIIINPAPAAPTEPQPQSAAAQYAAPEPAPVVPTVQQGVHNLGPNGTMNPEAVAKNTQELGNDQARVAAAQSAATAPITEKYIAGRQQVEANAQDLLNQMKGHNDAFNTYIQSNPINPDAYMENKSAGKKVLSGLGLILGGMGAGALGSTDNPALRFVNAQIDRDIAAQQQRVNNQRTVLGAYQDLYGEGVSANNLTKASLLDIYGHKLDLLASQFGTPTAMMAAKKFKIDSAIEKSRLFQESAVNLSNLPGSRPTSSDEGAMNSPRGTQAPGQQGPTTAQSGMTTKDLQSMHEQQMQAGIPSESGSTPQKVSPLSLEGDNNRILHPDAEAKLNNVRWGAKKIAQDFPDVKSQYDQAYNADQQLKQVNGLYKRLYGETNGLSGRIHRGVNPHAIAAGAGAIGTGIGAAMGAAAGGVGAVPGAIAGGSVGTALGEGVGHGVQALTNNGTNQEYDRDLEALKGIISASLKNRGDMTVEEAVKKFAPTDRDSEEQAFKKREEFKRFVSSHIDKGMLHLHGMAEDTK